LPGPVHSNEVLVIVVFLNDCAHPVPFILVVTCLVLNVAEIPHLWQREVGLAKSSFLPIHEPCLEGQLLVRPCGFPLLGNGACRVEDRGF
jgi:hypothetical protein